jgi:type II secretory pathway component PulJ
MPRNRHGAALLEVMVALALLAGAGASLVSLLGAAFRSEATMRDREERYERLDRALTLLSLMGRADLDRRIGRHETGDIVTDVQRPERALYRIAVGTNGTDGREMLVTVVYRPEGSRK